MSGLAIKHKASQSMNGRNTITCAYDHDDVYGKKGSGLELRLFEKSNRVRLEYMNEECCVPAYGPSSRIEYPGAVYLVIARGNKRKAIKEQWTSDYRSCCCLGGSTPFCQSLEIDGKVDSIIEYCRRASITVFASCSKLYEPELVK